MDSILINVESKARFFWNQSSHEPLEIKNNSESINNILNFSSKEEAEQFAESDYLNFIAIITVIHKKQKCSFKIFLSCLSSNWFKQQGID